MKNIINNKIKCLECGKYFEQINLSHLKKCSGITTLQYRKKYPDAEFVCEKLKKEQSLKVSAENNSMFGKFGKNHPAFGYKHSEEFKKEQSENRKGKKNPFFGKIHSEEYINYRKSLVGEKNYFFSRKHSEKSKKLIGVKSRERIVKKLGDFEYFNPNYSYNSNIFFHFLNNSFGWNGIYAENYGEFCVKGLNYYLDYYEEKNGIIIEYDEEYHNNQKEKDIKRQEKIEIKMNPNLFIRFEEEHMKYQPSLLSQFACGII